MQRRLLLLLLLPACVKSPGGSTSDAAPGPDGMPMDQRIAAATTTATTNPQCAQQTAPFYWEIGDGSGKIVGGSVDLLGNSTHYTADSAMNIASASKWIFGAYVLETHADNLAAIDLPSMEMQSGYVSLNYDSCVLATSVDDCLSKNNNGVQTASAVGKFDYDGGHFQHYASVLGLGGDSSAQLAVDIGGALGTDLGITYSSPQLAAGVNTTPASYAKFLRKILDGGLAISSHLGDAAVCTLPGGSCPAIYSPAAPYAWHYSYGHWVEDDPSGDGAFSSPGAFGFYPWIDATKTYYGVVARKVIGGGAYLDSAKCGALIRKAFETGQAQ